jgi:hypothetical protein
MIVLFNTTVDDDLQPKKGAPKKPNIFLPYHLKIFTRDVSRDGLGF